MRTRWFLLLSLAIVTAGGLQRVVASWEVLQREGAPPRLLGVDSYFHARMAQYTAVHFPDQLRWDGAAFFPVLRKQNLSGLFNVFHAAVAKTYASMTGTDLRSAVYRTGAWLPPVVAMFTMMLLLAFVRRLEDGRSAIIAAGLLVLYPATYLARSTYGFLDQHVLEVFLALGTVAGLFLCVESGGRWRYAILGSLPLVAFLFSWLGAASYFLHLGLFTVVLLAASAGSGTQLKIAGRALLRLFLSAAVLYAAFQYASPELAMELRPGFRHLIGPALAALGLASWLVSRQLLSSRWSPEVRRGLVLGGAFVAAGILLLALPQLRDLVERTLRRQAVDITEIDVSWVSTFYLFGPVVPLAALGWIRHLYAGSPAAKAVAAYAALTVVLWLTSGDFDYVPPVFVAMYGGVALAWIFREWASARLVGGGLVLLILVWPWAFGKNPASIADSREATVLYGESWYEAMAWLRSHTPEPARAYNQPIRDLSDLPNDRPDYGVLSSWEFGNAVTELGRRSPAFSRFPSSKGTAWMLSRTPGEERVARCPECRDGQEIRYAVVDARNAADWYAVSLMRAEGRKTAIEPDRAAAQDPLPVFSRIFDEAMAVRLVHSPGSVPGLELVYQSSQRSVMFYEYEHETDRLARRSFSLSSGSKPPWSESFSRQEPFKTGGYTYYGIDTVRSVQIFQFTNQSTPNETIFGGPPDGGHSGL